MGQFQIKKLDTNYTNIKDLKRVRDIECKAGRYDAVFKKNQFHHAYLYTT